MLWSFKSPPDFFLIVSKSHFPILGKKKKKKKKGPSLDLI